MVDDRLWAIMEIDREFADAVFPQQDHQMFEQRSPPMGSIGFGLCSVSGRKRVPSPAARISALIPRAPLHQHL